MGGAILERQVYLIIAHNQKDLLLKLVKSLDYEFNDIIVHIDKKVKNWDFSEIKKAVKKSNIEIYNEISVFWGGDTQIQVTMFLLEKASIHKYKYYHLLSGVDFPIKPIRTIFDFFNESLDVEYISFANKKFNVKYADRVKYFWFLQRFRRNRFLSRIIGLSVRIQKLLRINRLRKVNIELQKGSNWFSITDELVQYILSNKLFVEKFFKLSHCADELFIQTLVYNNDYFMNRVYNGGLIGGSFRYVDWNRGNPYTWMEEDLHQLLDSECLFARKFNLDIDSNIIDKLEENIHHIE
uniref:Peptide O-xylosyltransferase n=1 Tax=Streptococcus suis TaxID=1307 RepID=A0A1C9IEZ9_STRSU|nr:Glycosyltransferase [Streptococcus suis]AOP03444.1 Glycosyltransferase [Streptococcus suis]